MPEILAVERIGTAIKNMPDKVKVELDIGEMFGLIDYHWQIFNGIPKEVYDVMTKAGHPFSVTAEKHKRRAIQLRNLLDDTWPK